MVTRDAGNDERLPGLAAAPPPDPDASAGQLESYVRAGMHTDRTPGAVVAICHPHRMYKVPSGLLDALRARGFDVHVVETQPERSDSIAGIRQALHAATATGQPLDIVVFSGDGTLDHHVLVAAFQAFYPNLVADREGEITLEEPSAEERAAVPAEYRSAFLPPPDTAGIEPDDATIRTIWTHRMHLRRHLRRGRSLRRLERRSGRSLSDPLVRIAAFASLFPHRARIRPHGYDLSGLANASREATFRGLYPFVRSIAVFPCGTAADNALYAGVPGWGFAQTAKLLRGWSLFDGLRSWWEDRARRRFLDYFTRDGVVVPARVSIVGLDGDWQLLCSHAASGPAGGRFFEGDLERKASGIAGYLSMFPTVTWQEGLFNENVVRVRALTPDGEARLDTVGRLVEGLYTNRAFIAGIASFPSANPTGFAGQSSLVVGPPLAYRDMDGAFKIDFRGLFTVMEAITKGILGRWMHLVGLGVGKLAGGGRFSAASPEHQLTLGEGESVELRFSGIDGRTKAVSTQVSGDPFQAHRMDIRVAWGPLPLLSAPDSLLIAAAQRSLARLRDEQSWDLQTVFIGGLPIYRHRVGLPWSRELEARTGLVDPPPVLPARLDRAQARLFAVWRAAGVTGFIDTTEQGLQLGRRGRHAHDTDARAHLIVLRERSRTLLVRQLRQVEEGIFESKTHYRWWWGSWVVHDHEVRAWDADGEARILLEERWFRNADEFQAEAPSFFRFDRG